MADQRNHRGWAGIGAMALAVGLSSTAAWGAAPSSPPSGKASPLSGIAVSGGSGSLSVTGYLINSSCAVSVDKNSDEFTLSQEQVRNSSRNDKLVSLRFLFTLTGCADTPLQLGIAGDPYGGTANPVEVSMFDFDDTNKGLFYQLQIEPDQASATSWFVGNSNVKSETKSFSFYNMNISNTPTVLVPHTDSEHFTLLLHVTRNEIAHPVYDNADVERVNATFTYYFTYF
ncbi:type-1 fimbrial protein, a chain [Edwardsiella tarda]|uniref:type-1 fimbrial protein, a chain n=1 Tax=Edwardsiella tarda TaxID=636 RepID=UPI003A8C4D79